MAIIYHILNSTIVTDNKAFRIVRSEIIQSSCKLHICSHPAFERALKSHLFYCIYCNFHPCILVDIVMYSDYSRPIIVWLGTIKHLILLGLIYTREYSRKCSRSDFRLRIYTCANIHTNVRGVIFAYVFTLAWTFARMFTVVRGVIGQLRELFANKCK